MPGADISPTVPPSPRQADGTLSRSPSTAADTQPNMLRSIGQYRILRLLGEGGMGAVYEAEQAHPRRIVALKVIRAAWAGPDLVHRFEQESQALGRLHHPGIAQIYEAGSADTGLVQQPYFAMELIHGQPLTQYADDHRLNTNERLMLMIQVCEAVTHAHQRGIIHRDLKPGNILVDENGQPKILDFGLALMTDSDAQATRRTDLGQVLGTLAYMSPEQVLGDPLALDTRSDVYSLGVILYELLAGKGPYTISRQLHEAVQTIRDSNPTRLGAVSRTYRGDIETIVSKALEKDKTRRYGSAAALANDIRRYLNEEPIVARPASTRYRVRKFARRHRVLVIAVSAVFLALLVGVVVSTWQATRAHRAELRAQTEADSAKAVVEFLQNDLLAEASANKQAGPNLKPDPDLKVRTAVERAAAKVGGKFERQPEVEAAIRETLGETYMDLGLYSEARKQLERALALRRRTRGLDDTKTIESMFQLGRAAIFQADYGAAEPLLNNALTISRRLLGPEDPQTLKCINALAAIYREQGKYPQAEALNTTLIEIRRRTLGPEHPDTLATMNNLAITYSLEGKATKAEELDRVVVAGRQRALGPEHPDTLTSMNNLALDYQDEGRYAETEEQLRQVAEIQKRVLGPDHPDTLRTVNNLAVILLLQGKYGEAEKMFSECLERKRRVLGPEHLDTLMTLSNLAVTYTNEGKFLEAEALNRQVLAMHRRLVGPEHADTINDIANLATAQFGAGKRTQAEALLLQDLETSSRVLGAEHTHTLEILSDLAFLYQREGRYADAKNYAAKALAAKKHALGQDHVDTLSAALDLALAYESLKRFTECTALARETFEAEKRKQPDNWQRFRAESLLGAGLSGQKRYAEAEPFLRDGYQGMLARRKLMAASDRYHLSLTRLWLANLYRRWGKPDEP